MKEKNHIIRLCKKFKEGEYGLVEFQSRVQTANFPEELLELQEWALNRLEEIRFTELETDFYNLGLEVVNKLLKNLS